MSVIFSTRASSILYDFIKTYNRGGYLIPANVCPIIPITFCTAGIPFTFVDINEESYCIEENTCLQLFANNPKKFAGLLFVRTYGYAYDTQPFFQKIKSIDDELKIIDDRCLCIPDINKHNNSDLILYSTGYAKPVDFGFGGIGIVNNKLNIIKHNAPVYMNFDIESFYKNALDKNILLTEMPDGWLDHSTYTGDPNLYIRQIEIEKTKILHHKNLLNKIYNHLLPDDIKLSVGFHDWRFNILVKNKKKILSKIFENKFYASSHFKPSNVLFDKKKFPVSEKLYANIINLFNDYNFSSDQAEQVAKIIKNNL